MKQFYVAKNFRESGMDMIENINTIVDEYRAQGFILTVRQLYYQLVARGIIPNTLQEYKRIANLINDAKLAGLIDWSMIEDRTRAFIRRSRWNSPQDILDASASSYHMDMWIKQEYRVFVIVEKEALVGVLEDTCNKWDAPLLAARGYPSGSVLREFSIDDVMEATNNGQVPVILHLGDHDPSGIDMTRDLKERIELFAEGDIELERIALNMRQVEEQKPPENPAKATDSRFIEYRRKFGTKSWELDALSPSYLANLVNGHIHRYVDMAEWRKREIEIDAIKGKIKYIAQNWQKFGSKK